MTIKNIFINLIFLLSSFTLVAQEQDYAEISFIGYDDYSKKLYLNDRLITTYGRGEVVKLKIYSKGRMTVTLLFAGARAEGIIEVKENKSYYFLAGSEKVDDRRYRFETVPKEDYDFLKNYFEKKKKITYSVVNMEEDIKKPIGKLDDSQISREKQGTGFLINSDGYVITNFHVIDGAKKITVKGIKGDYNTPFALEVIAVDRQLDLALLKVNSKLITFETPPYSIESSKSIETAADVFALGYPMKNMMGEEVKITTGIVNSASGYKGSISEFQISASVQPGNSGGPLLNKDGNIVGVVSAKIKSDAVDNVGYAIKSDYLAFFLEQIEGISFKKEKETFEETDLSSHVKRTSNFVYIIETE